MSFGCCNNLTHAAIKHPAENCNSLQCANFVFYRELTNGPVKHLAGRCRSLESVSFDCCYGFADEAVKRLAEKRRGSQSVGLRRRDKLASTPRRSASACGA